MPIMIALHVLLIVLVIHPVTSTIQVIGTGTGRTGSTTLHEALSILGYKTYHMKEVLMGGKQVGAELDFWFDAFTTNCSRPHELRDIFDRSGYNATVHAINFPCHDALLFDMYPQAKVIHTERTSAEVWYDSVSNSVCKVMEDSWFGRILGLFFPTFRKFQRFAPMLLGRTVFGIYGPIENISQQYCMEHKDQIIGFYNAHNARIREIVPAERLLIISNHKDGWKPICDFLGVPIPDVPFPHVNKRESMVKNMLSMLGSKYGNFSPVVKLLVFFILFLPFLELLRRVATKTTKPKAE
ncbi:hypothetical protein HJC23_009213 [Cyclotella cryptica]|uniref:NAD dependent epimerase/dehydratase n=1 Tax=Cyclotella cryptica TaxID=29204 RepID=A0ABD3P1I8_9STRA|eukprot:CCRYP_018279-RA/>CCRYP_018279-RA protein AED:0.30 eAED:0.30 QI:0/-1/0/1/-1/1/1/0/296